MPFPKMGHAIIINNVISEKPGTKKDVEALEATNKTMGFEVHVHNDCSDTVIIDDDDDESCPGQFSLSLAMYSVEEYPDNFKWNQLTLNRR